MAVNYAEKNGLIVELVLAFLSKSDRKNLEYKLFVFLKTIFLYCFIVLPFENQWVTYTGELLFNQN